MFCNGKNPINSKIPIKRINKVGKGKKVTIIGAGNVGATVAYSLAMKGSCHFIVLRDRNVEIAKGKALDMSQAANAFPLAISTFLSRSTMKWHDPFIASE